MSTEIDATYKVTTPMFCGGADPGRAEFRLSSFKGVLRYWWRALAWVEYSGKLALIREHEDALFGSTGVGQSLVTMRLTGTVEDDLETEKKGASLMVGGKTGHGQNPYTGGFVGPGARYLGYGVMDHRGKLSRGCLCAPFEFEVRMRVRESAGTGKDVKLDLR